MTAEAAAPGGDRERRRADAEHGAERRASPSRWTVPILAVAFLLSGAAGLIHEVVWARLMGHVFGATSLAISTVLAAYMGGLALGSYWIGRRTARLKNRPRAYALMEIGIGAFALLIPLLLGAVEPLYGWLWRTFHFSFAVFTLLRFLVAGGLLLGPTFLMGATLPVLADYLAGLLPPKGRPLAPQWLYTVNLVGAAFGVAAGGFALMPGLGVWGAIFAGAALNIGVGLIVLALARTPDAARERPPTHETPPAARASAPPRRRIGMLLLAAAFVSGFTSFATQVAWTRVLVLVVGSTTYAFSTVLLAYLAALAAGSAWASRRGERVKEVGPDLAVAHMLMALGVLGAIQSVNALPTWYPRIVLAWRPESLAGIVAMNSTVVFGILILPVLFAGAILPLAMVGILKEGARGTGEEIGSIYAINTVGAILGAILGGFVLIPTIGSENTLLCMALTAAVLGVLFAFSGTRRPWLVNSSLAGAGLVLAGSIFSPQWRHQALNAGLFETGRVEEGRTADRGDKVLFHREGATATVMVMQSPRGGTHLRINGRTNASDGSNDMSTQVLVAQIPLLLAPRGDEVFIIGVGSGVTMGSALQSPARRVTTVEMESAVVDASRFFLHVNHDPLNDPRLVLHRDDARHILLASRDTYDVIISEPSHPWVAGVANLFTRDFFETAARRLKDDGLFAQWLQTYQISYDSFRVLLATFQSVYPEVLIFRSRGTDCILVGSRRPLKIDLAEMDRRWADPAVAAENARVGIDRPEDLLAALYTGPEDVRAIVSGAPINTDDNMYVEFHAPREMIGKLNVATRQIFGLLEKTPAESVLADPRALLSSPERLRGLVAALTRMKRDTSRYESLLKTMH